MKPSAIRRLGLTYESLREFNDGIVCVALTGFGLDGGDDPAFDYVIQAATGVAAMTGDPDGPPTLPGYSSADNSTGLTAALGLLAQIVSGRGGQVDVSSAGRDALAAELPRCGVPQRRRPNRSDIPTARTRTTFRRSCSRPPTATSRCSSPTTRSGRRSPQRPASRASRRWPNAPPAATRCSRVVSAALAADTAVSWQERLRPLGIPVAAVRTLPEALAATPEVVVTAGEFRAGGQPDPDRRLRTRPTGRHRASTSTAPWLASRLTRRNSPSPSTCPERLGR